MPRPFRLITSQGRIADRTPGAISGAWATSELLADRLGLEAVVLGAPSEHRTDDWRVSLPAAADVLVELRRSVLDAIAGGHRPLLAINTCSASLATLPAAASVIPDLKVLWVDAHGDFNTPATTESGYLGGMVLAAACGLWDSGHGSGVDPDRILVAGARDIDVKELALMKQAGVCMLSTAETDPKGVLAFLGESPVWIHIDWDSMEPGLVPAAYGVPDGLLPDQFRDVFEAIPPQQIVGVELAEFELPEAGSERSRALATISDVVAPLLRDHALI